MSEQVLNSGCFKPKYTDETIGKKYGYLTVVQIIKVGSVRHFKCKCVCGKERLIRPNRVISGLSRSCGCKKSEFLFKHGMIKTPTYKCWAGLRSRCLNPDSKDFSNYGGRGIKVCKRWDKFENFLKDMGVRPKGMSIDRIDFNGDYEPSNCRWADAKTQTENRRCSSKTYDAQAKKIKELEDYIFHLEAALQFKP